MAEAISYIKDGEPYALVPAGFMYRGRFFGRAATRTGWRNVVIPQAQFYQLLTSSSP